MRIASLASNEQVGYTIAMSVDPISAALGAIPLAKDAASSIRNRNELRNAIRAIRHAVTSASGLTDAERELCSARIESLVVDPQSIQAIHAYLDRGSPEAVATFSARLSALLADIPGPRSESLASICTDALVDERHRIKRSDREGAHLDSLVLGHQLAAVERSVLDEITAAVADPAHAPPSSLYLPPTRVEDANPFELGVTHSPIADRYKNSGAFCPPYVPRIALDAALTRAFVEEQQVQTILVHGPSKSGKSRALFEFARRHLPAWQLAAPHPYAGAKALLEAAEAVDTGSPLIVWLDDIGLFLGAESATLHGALRTLQHLVPQLVILGTVRNQVLAELDRQPPRANRLLDGATRIRASSDLTEDEKIRAEKLYPGETFRSGVAEHFVAAIELQRRYATADARGRALLSAAIDWHRATLGLPVHKDILAGLTSFLFEHQRAALGPALSESDFEAGLRWATEPVSEVIAPLSAVDVDARFWRVFDYLAALDDGEVQAPGHEPRAVSRDTWEWLLSHAPPQAQIRIASTAFGRGEYALAHTALDDLVRRSNGETRAQAAYVLGHVLKDRDRDEALEAWKISLSSERPSLRSWAARLAGRLAASGDDVDSATTFFHVAMEGEDQEVAEMAAVELGRTLLAAEEHSAAREPFEIAYPSSNPDVRAAACIGLGTLAEADVDRESAESYFREALGLGSVEHFRAALRLADTLSHYTGLDEDGPYPADIANERDQLLEEVAESDNADVAIAACWRLERIREMEDDHEASTVWTRRAAALGDSTAQWYRRIEAGEF